MGVATDRFGLLGVPGGDGVTQEEEGLVSTVSVPQAPLDPRMARGLGSVGTEATKTALDPREVTGGTYLPLFPSQCAHGASLALLTPPRGGWAELLPGCWPPGGTHGASALAHSRGACPQLALGLILCLQDGP